MLTTAGKVFCVYAEVKQHSFGGNDIFNQYGFHQKKNPDY